ncbi:unnamed protein product [Urochloa humidicola]
MQTLIPPVRRPSPSGTPQKSAPLEETEVTGKYFYCYGRAIEYEPLRSEFIASVPSDRYRILTPQDYPLVGHLLKTSQT